jgi:hypothetical protein
MREIRKSGSEGGARQTNVSFLPLSAGDGVSPAFWCLRERLSPQASDLKGDLHDTPRIEGVEVLGGTLMPVVRTDAITGNFC